MITFDKVSFAYGTQEVLHAVSFSINADERVAILGGSGGGKTTILKLVLGLIRPDSGKIIIDGEDINGKTEDELRAVRMKFSIVFQEGALFDSLTVGENVLFSLELREDYDAQNKEDVVEGLLQMVDIADAGPKYPSITER